MDETELIRRILDGEKPLFRILVERYKDFSLTLAYSIVKTKEEAEDVVQDSFIKAFKALQKFKLESSFKTWFYRIVVNTSYHLLEKRKLRRTVPLEHLTSLESSGTAGDDAIRTNERRRIIHAALSGLKPKEALLLKLCYLGEQSHNEIASITGLSVADVKLTLHRARKSFHDQLQRIVGDEIDDIL